MSPNGENKYRSFLLLLLVVSLSSCQRQININLGTSPPQLVVEGEITTGYPPVVLLTTTINYFSSVNLTTLQNSFVHGATVTVTCGSRTVPLREYSLDTTGGNKYYLYSVDTANLGNILIGQVDSFYKLTIVYSGATYTSITKIPNPKGVDTMWYGVPTFKNSKTPDSAVEMYANYQDPDTPGNYVRYFTKINSQPFYPGQLFSDALVNGQLVKQLPLPVGYLQTQNANNDSLIYVYPGDTVVLMWCEIDKGVYDFWNTLQFATNAVGNPFSTPINVQTNMSGGALGIWAGYGATYDTLIVH